MRFLEVDLSQLELELLRSDIVVRVIPVQDKPVTLGRDLSNRVVLVDDSVSAHHAVVERGPSGPLIRDLGSTNGTTVNGQPVVSRRTLEHGDRLKLGPDVELRVRFVGDQLGGQLMLRDVTAGTAYLIGERFLIGSDPEAHGRLVDGPARAAVLMVHGDGEVWLSNKVAGEERALEIGDGFEVAGSEFRLELSPSGSSLPPTAQPTLTARFPYRLTVTLDQAAGAMAVLRDERTHKECTIRSEQRVALLYLLAKQLRDDRALRVLPPLAGWCHDEDLMVGVWGRQGLKGAASKYSVLLHRVRKDIETADLDPTCIEKRRGATRLHVGKVVLT